MDRDVVPHSLHMLLEHGLVLNINGHAHIRLLAHAVVSRPELCQRIPLRQLPALLLRLRPPWHLLTKWPPGLPVPDHFIEPVYG